MGCKNEFIEQSFFDSAVCSGNGVCVNSTCKCDDGFSGLGDMVDSTNMDCQIRESLLYNWRVVTLILWVVEFIYTTRIVLMFWYRKKYHDSKGAILRKVKHRDFRVCLNTINFRLMVMICIFAFFRVLEGVIRIAKTPMPMGEFFCGELGVVSSWCQALQSEQNNELTQRLTLHSWG